MKPPGPNDPEVKQVCHELKQFDPLINLINFADDKEYFVRNCHAQHFGSSS
jgi:hypothetical protein